MNSNSPFFSIVLPTYNRTNILLNTIKSVLAQTFTDWELIIIDDGSTDNTKQLVESFKDTRVKYFYQNNAERSAARNNGISKSTGQYICFLDSDDSWQINHLAVLYNRIAEDGYKEVMYITDVIRNENGKISNVEHEEISSHKNAVCYFLMARESVIPSRVAIHNNILNKLKFDVNLKDVEDTDLWIQIAASYPIVTINAPTAIYFLHDDNSTNKKKNPFINQLKGLNKIFSSKNLRGLIPNEIKNKKYSSCYFGIARYHEWAGNYFQMVWNLLISIFYLPFDSSTKGKLYLIFSHLPMAFGFKK